MTATSSASASARILIVDDREANVRLLEQLLAQAGYKSIISTQDPRQALPLYLTQNPDLILLDLHMPHMDGFAVLEQIVPRIAKGLFLPILVLTADASSETKQRALAMGARDFLTKPFDPHEVLLRVANLLETRSLHVVLKNQNKLLEERVRERTYDFQEAQLEIMDRLALAAEYRDDETGRHAQRVGRTSALVAERLGFPEQDTALIRRAAPLHDVGKIGIPDEILLKPGSLTEAEFNEMKGHTMVGARILSGSRFRVLQLAEDIALTHHEKWDGGGYFGLREDTIPLVGRIVAIADVFDALTHERPYKQAWPESKAVEEVASLSGKHFDPKVVEAFLAVQAESDLPDPPASTLGPALPNRDVIVSAGEELLAG
jgi:putative two-component system response regulator